jgi:hypothetical protein
MLRCLTEDRPLHRLPCDGLTEAHSAACCGLCQSRAGFLNRQFLLNHMGQLPQTWHWHLLFVLLAT